MISSFVVAAPRLEERGRREEVVIRNFHWRHDTMVEFVPWQQHLSPSPSCFLCLAVFRGDKSRPAIQKGKDGVHAVLFGRMRGYTWLAALFVGRIGSIDCFLTTILQPFRVVDPKYNIKYLGRLLLRLS